MAKGKTAIVTGGTRGIGFAIAKEMLRVGIAVVICSRNKKQLKDAVKELSSNGQKAYGVVADVSNFNDCKKLIKFALSKTGRIDVLVNNVGTFGPIGFLETTNPKEWESVWRTNVLSSVFLSKLAIPIMRKNGGGKIINIAGAGAGGPRALPRFSAYYTTKTAVVALTQNLAGELESKNIQVNAVSPGSVASELTLSLLKLKKSQVGEDMYKTSSQLKKEGGMPPELTAKLVAFLSSKESDHITGRLLSAKWDNIAKLKKRKKLGQSLYKLRRIDNDLFSEKK